MHERTHELIQVDDDFTCHTFAYLTIILCVSLFVYQLNDTSSSSYEIGSSLVVSGDGRYHNVEALHTIVRQCAANGVSRVVMGLHGTVSTPCMSAIVRRLHLYGAIILTASHNPGGPDADFGIKYNTSNGGPANEALTDKIYQLTTKITNYKITQEIPQV